MQIIPSNSSPVHVYDSQASRGSPWPWCCAVQAASLSAATTGMQGLQAEVPVCKAFPCPCPRQHAGTHFCVSKAFTTKSRAATGGGPAGTPLPGPAGSATALAAPAALASASAKASATAAAITGSSASLCPLLRGLPPGELPAGGVPGLPEPTRAGAPSLSDAAAAPAASAAAELAAAACVVVGGSAAAAAGVEMVLGMPASCARRSQSATSTVTANEPVHQQAPPHKFLHEKTLQYCPSYTASCMVHAYSSTVICARQCATSNTCRAACLQWRWSEKDACSTWLALAQGRWLCCLLLLLLWRALPAW